MELDDFCVDIAKNGRAKCHFKDCNQKFQPGDLRIGKVINDHYAVYDGETGTRTIFYHVACYAKMVPKMRKSTKRITKTSDIKRFDTLSRENQLIVMEALGIQ